MKSYGDYLVEYTDNQRVRTPKAKTVEPENGHVGRDIRNKTPLDNGQRDRHRTAFRGQLLHRKMDNKPQPERETRNNHNELDNKPPVKRKQTVKSYSDFLNENNNG